MKVAVLDGKHPGPISALQFNPRFMTFVSACSNTVRASLSYQCVIDLLLIVLILIFKIYFLNRPFGSRVLMTCKGAKDHHHGVKLDPALQTS